MNIDWNSVVQTALMALISVAVPILVYAMVGLVTSARDWFKSRKDSAWYFDAGFIVSDSVAATAQTLGDEIKEASKDGKFTEDEKAKLFTHAADMAKKAIGQVPAHIFPLFESWLRSKIEAEVAKLKWFSKTGPASTPPVGGLVKVNLVASKEI